MFHSASPVDSGPGNGRFHQFNYLQRMAIYDLGKEPLRV